MGGRLKTNEVEAVIDVFKKMGVLLYTFQGGEPTLREDLPELIRYASEGHKYDVRFTTNGFIEDPIGYLQYLVGLGLTYVDISIDGIGKQHDKIRGRPGSFERAVATVNAARAIAQAQESSGLRPLEILVNSTLEDPNSAESFWRELETYIGPLNTDGNSLLVPVFLSFNNRRYQVGRAAQLKTRAGTWEKSFDDLRTPTCILGQDRILIRPDGSIGHCWIGYAGREYGDIDRSSLGAIKTSLVANLNRIQDTPEYRMALGDGMREIVEYVDRSLFPETFENWCTAAAIAIAVWDNMNRLAKEQSRAINDAQVVKQANEIVADKLGFSKS